MFRKQVTYKSAKRRPAVVGADLTPEEYEVQSTPVQEDEEVQPSPQRPTPLRRQKELGETPARSTPSKMPRKTPRKTPRKKKLKIFDSEGEGEDDEPEPAPPKKKTPRRRPADEASAARKLKTPKKTTLPQAEAHTEEPASFPRSTSESPTKRRKLTPPSTSLRLSRSPTSSPAHPGTLHAVSSDSDNPAPSPRRRTLTPGQTHNHAAPAPPPRRSKAATTRAGWRNLATTARPPARTTTPPRLTTPPPKPFLTLKRIQTRTAAPGPSPNSGVHRRNRYKWVPTVTTRHPRPRSPPQKRRTATLYDAAAGRINYEGFIKPAYENEFGEVARRSTKVQPADQVLGRRRRFPRGLERNLEFEEEGVVVPESDLLTAVHQYVADLYAGNGLGERGSYIFDETALVGIGVLVEERVRAMLGREGHLALVDPVDGFVDDKEEGGVVENVEEDVEEGAGVEESREEAPEVQEVVSETGDSSDAD